MLEFIILEGLTNKLELQIEMKHQDLSLGFLLQLAYMVIRIKILELGTEVWSQGQSWEAHPLTATIRRAATMANQMLAYS